MEYRQAPEVKAIADDLIWEHHEDLAEDGPHIEYVMTRSAATKPPRQMFKVRKITGLHAYLAAGKARPEKWVTDPQPEAFVVVEVAQFWWSALEEVQRKALVDHALSHLSYDPDNESWTIEPPEYGEFPGVLERWGFWRPGDDFKDFAQAISEQLSLLPEEERARLAVPPEMREQIKSGEVSLTVHQASITQEIIAETVDPETGEVLEEAPAEPVGVASE